MVEALAKIGEQMKHNPEKAAEVFAAIFRNVSEGRAYKQPRTLLLHVNSTPPPLLFPDSCQASWIVPPGAL